MIETGLRAEGGEARDEQGDRTEDAKCAVIVKISDKGEFEFFKSVCP